MATRIARLTAHDIRFPTSDFAHGSDAMNPDPDYSAAAVVLETDAGLTGHGMTFTIGHGNDLCVHAIRAYERLVVGLDLDKVEADLGGFWRALAGDSQLRWLGPEKGVVHLALAAVVNAVWDLLARRDGKPLWKYLADLSPAEIVRAVDFRHIGDVLPPDAALAMLERQAAGRETREAELRRDGYPAYVTSAGWIGYSEETIRQRCRDAMAAGWSRFKVKVGADPTADAERCRIVRDEIGPERMMMVDANQVWDVDEAIEAMKPLSAFDPLWIEEPTSPDDILGHARIRREIHPVGVATGEHCQNRVVVKQLLQAEAIDFLQIDGCRLGGVNEVIAALLLAAHFDVPVCPHAGGVGLCQHVQHFSMFDYIAVSGSLENRMIEYADHLHEHFVVPLDVREARYWPPTAPGFGLEFRADSLDRHRYPDGAEWKSRVEDDHPSR